MWKSLTQSITESLFRALAVFFPPTGETLPLDPALILVFSTTGIGDALFDTAAVHSLKLAYPESKIVVCAHRKRSTVFLHDSDVDEVVPYGKSPVYAFRLLRRFRRNRPELVILLNINPEVVPIAYCVNRRALFGGDWRCGNYGFLLSHGVQLPEEGHILRLGAAIAHAAGGAEDAYTMIYQPKTSERETIRERFVDWIDQPFVIFQAGGGEVVLGATGLSTPMSGISNGSSGTIGCRSFLPGAGIMRMRLGRSSLPVLVSSTSATRQRLRKLPCCLPTRLCLSARIPESSSWPTQQGALRWPFSITPVPVR